MSFVEKFLKDNPEDKFFNLKRKEDISTIYHGEYKEFHDGLDYWCNKVPVGFAVDCDLILGLFGVGGAIAVACTKLNNAWTFKIVKKKKQGMPDILVSLGYEFDKEYQEADLYQIDNLIK